MKSIFVLALFIAWPLSAALPVKPAEPAVQTAWEPSEADVLKVKMLSYLHFRAKDGSDVGFTRMTWYQNPPDAALPGIFVAVDYAAVLPGTGTRCGTLMWHRLADGGFELLRDQDKTIDKADRKHTDTGPGCKSP